MWRFAAAWTVLACCLDAATGIAPEEYAARRERVRQHLAREESVLVLYGNTEAERGDLRNRFFQEPNFYYLSGWTEPGAVLLLTAKDDYLFLPPRTEVKERYTGKKLAPGDAEAKAVTGFANVLPVEKLEITFFTSLEQAKKIAGLHQFDRLPHLRKLTNGRQVDNAAPMLFPLRMKKSAAEIALMEQSVEATIGAHRAAWLQAAPNLHEYQVAATMVNAFSQAGCERTAYPPIVGSGPNSTILHYAKSERRMDAGEVLLMDVGAECSMYAADLTRTIPVDRKFTERQLELYKVVLGAQRAAIAAVKPGMTLSKIGDNSLYKVAFEYINTHGKSLSGEPLGKYFNHGLGHHIGLEVHDPGTPEISLEPGMVITIEPGIYIPEEKTGIRIEDMVLVTEDGHRVLSTKLPKNPDAVENALREGAGK